MRGRGGREGESERERESERGRKREVRGRDKAGGGRVVVVQMSPLR